MGMFIKANGKMIKLMAMANIHIWMAQDTKDFGRKTSNKALEKSTGLMVLNLRVIIQMEKSKEMGCLCGLITRNIKDNSRIT